MDSIIITPITIEMVRFNEKYWQDAVCMLLLYSSYLYSYIWCVFLGFRINLETGAEKGGRGRGQGSYHQDGPFVGADTVYIETSSDAVENNRK